LDVLENEDPSRGTWFAHQISLGREATGAGSTQHHFQKFFTREARKGVFFMNVRGALRHPFGRNPETLGVKDLSVVGAVVFFFVLSVVHLVAPTEANGNSRKCSTVRVFSGVLT
jgi:hypothetical protein